MRNTPIIFMENKASAYKVQIRSRSQEIFGEKDEIAKSL